MKKIFAILVATALFAVPVFAEEHAATTTGHEKTCMGDKKCAEDAKCEAGNKKCHEAKSKAEKTATTQKEHAEQHAAK